jgi:biotin operon repressor
MRWISKGLVVLEAIGSTMDCPTIAKLSAVTGLSRAAVGRCLYTLSQLGYAAKVDGQGYAAKAGLSINPYRTPDRLREEKSPRLLPRKTLEADKTINRKSHYMETRIRR